LRICLQPATRALSVLISFSSASFANLRIRGQLLIQATSAPDQSAKITSPTRLPSGSSTDRMFNVLPS
jgi:hypothetical protein